MTNHVKIHGIIPRIQYTADGALTTYEFPFAIFSEDDIEVYLNNTKQSSTAYTVTGVRDSEGGSVTFVSAPENGTIITIVRNLSIERTSDFQEGGALRADTLNDEFDYQIACQQQIAENLNRSMVLPPYSIANDIDLTLPTPSAGKAIVWNAAGTNLENSTVAVNALESTLNGYKTAAETAATTATTKAGIASDKADIATTKAQIATEKAAEAATTLTSKANKDMDNLSSTGKEAIIALGMPDFSSGVSKSLDTIYQAESDGWILIRGASGGSAATLVLQYSTNSDMSSEVELIGDFFGCINNEKKFLPIPKGMYYKATQTTDYFQMTFYPVKGGINA